MVAGTTPATCYAVVSSDVKGCNATAPDTVSQGDKDTCPCFFHTLHSHLHFPLSAFLRLLLHGFQHFLYHFPALRRNILKGIRKLLL